MLVELHLANNKHNKEGQLLPNDFNSSVVKTSNEETEHLSRVQDSSSNLQGIEFGN
jgi:hypothetical protein